MALEHHLIDLRQAKIPLLSEFLTRTTVVDEKSRAQSNETQPQIMYVENVFPTLHGIESIQFYKIIPEVATRTGDFVEVKVIFGSVDRARIYIGICEDGVIYVLDETDPDAPVWELPVVTIDLGPDYRAARLTAATVNGITYLYYYNRSYLFTYDENAKEFSQVTTTGLTMTEVLGFTASNGYLIAYTSNAMAWSSTIDPLDFVPDSVTGAGGGDVSDITGAILFAAPTSLGVNFYTEANVVAATYTGNVQYPFKLNEVENSKGGIELDRIAYEANSDPQFVYTKAGLQTINSRVAETILPEVTDFLTGRRVESYDLVNNRLNQHNLPYYEEMLVKIKYINSRYLLISYGADELTNALVYDTSLQRTGKIAFDHVDVFEYIGKPVDIAKQVVTLLQPDGSCTIAYFNPNDPADTSHPAIVLLGKIQSRQSRMMTLLGAEFESIGQYQTEELFQSYNIPLLDGRNDNDAVGVEGYELYKAGSIRKLGWNITAKNHVLVIKGKFRLMTALVHYKIHGRR